MKHLFIVNPTAGGTDRTEAVKAQAASFFGPEDDVEIYVTKGRMDAPDKIRSEAAVCEELRVYACGGDGTFNECACGAAGLSNVAVAPFPTGTGNDFCRLFGSEADLYRDLPALAAGQPHPMDLIDCNGRMCANICSVGVDARVGTDVHKYSHFPLIGGVTGYVVSLIVNLCKGISAPMTVRCGSYDKTGKHTLVCVCNGRYYGGGFNPTKTAMPDDGLLDVFIVDKIHAAQLPVMLGLYASGNWDKIRKHLVHLQDTEVKVYFDRQQVINIDGEALYDTKVCMKLIPGAVNLIVPQGMKFFSVKNS